MKTCDTYDLIQPPKMQYPEFSERLKIAMDVRQYTVDDLAARTFTSPSTISMYRSGRRLPSILILRLIAAELHVTTDYLLGLSDTIFV